MLANQRHGRWIFLWPSGKKREQVFYCNGRHHQLAKYFHENGKLALEGNYQLGKPIGQWRFWDTNGRMHFFTPAAASSAGQFFLNEGNRALMNKQNERAIFLLQQAFRFSSQDADVHRSLGVAYATNKNGAKAAFHYRRYLQLNPAAQDRDRILKVLQNYGMNQATQGNAPEASEKKLTFQLAPNTSLAAETRPSTGAQSADRLYQEGRAAYKRKEYTEAAKLFDQAFQTDATMHKAIYRKALALRKIKAYQSAIQAYETFIKLEPTDPDAMYGLAETHRLSGNTAMARQFFQMYVRLEKRPSEQKYVDRANRYLAETN